MVNDSIAAAGRDVHHVFYLRLAGCESSSALLSASVHVLGGSSGTSTRDVSFLKKRSNLIAALFESLRPVWKELFFDELAIKIGKHEDQAGNGADEK